LENNKEQILFMVIWTAAGYMALAKFIYAFCLNKFEADPEGSSFKFFGAMSKGDRIYYCALYTSTLNCFIVMAIAFWGTISCDPPTEFRNDKDFLGNTGYNNDWCVDNPSTYDIFTMSYFAGYMFYELFSLVFLIGDLTSHTGKEDLMHHVLGLNAAICAILGGRYVLSVYRMTAVVELSSIFNNLRIGLTKHNNKEGSLYFYNGMLLTISFLVTRGFFYGWLLFCCLFSAI
jgi:hypothetical protein